MNLAEILKKENIFIGDSYTDTDGFYADYCGFLMERRVINNKEEVKRLFIKRENLSSTAIGKGAAAPHIFSEEFNEFLFSIAYIKNGVDFKAPDGGNVYLVFLIMSNERDVSLHLKMLGHITRLIKDTDVVDRMNEIPEPDPDKIYSLLAEKEKEKLSEPF
jgi:mannitol/fructose-specific phosphotransferase system IIA component (Ntr-type)